MVKDKEVQAAIIVSAANIAISIVGTGPSIIGGDTREVDQKKLTRIFELYEKARFELERIHYGNGG